MADSRGEPGLPGAMRALRAAWRGRAGNPLLLYHETARRRRIKAVPRQRRFGAVLAVIALAMLAAIFAHNERAAHYNQWQQDWIPELYGLAAALIVLVCCWLTAGLFNALSTAACLLARPGKRRLDLQLDPALAASRLSPPELLLGLLLPVLRPLLPVLAASALLVTGLLVHAASANEWYRNYNYGQLLDPNNMLGWLALLLYHSFAPWQQALLLAPLTTAALFVNSALASACLLLIAMLTGRGLRMDVHSGVLAGSYTLAALFFGGLMVLFTDALRYAWSSGSSSTSFALASLEPLPYALWVLVFAGIILLSALHLPRGGGLLLGYGLPLLVPASLSLPVWLAYKLSAGGLDPLHWFIDFTLCWSLLAPSSAVAVPHPLCLGVGPLVLAEPQWEHFRWPLLLAGQLLLLGGLLRAALRCIALECSAHEE